LAQARILFVSSNPNGLDSRGVDSRGADESSATDDVSIVKESEFAFDAVSGSPAVRPNARSHPRNSWDGAYGCSRQVLGDSVRPGYDYAQTEVVHCGSKGQAGVAPALPVCVALYLTQVLRAAAAALSIVVVGTPAQSAFQRFLGVDFGHQEMWGPEFLEGRRRVVVAVAHPAAKKVDEARKSLTAVQIDLIRAQLGVATTSPRPDA
jgi:hypothetical protein